MIALHYITVKECPLSYVSLENNLMNVSLDNIPIKSTLDCVPGEIKPTIIKPKKKSLRAMLLFEITT